jgi:23S rRNA pseudouridine2605 synthase
MAKRRKIERRREQRRLGLARVISKSGYCSRSQASELIRCSRVRLNGVVKRDPETPVRPGKDRVEIDGKPLETASRHYFVLNKPRGIVTTAEDEKGRDTVYSLLPVNAPWVGPVGRLDKASEGLLLLTNDSEWAARITDPNSHLEKIYHVQIASQAGEPLLRRLEKGISVGRGELLRVRKAEVLGGGERNSWLEITLEEGKNRHIRRMFDALGIAVLRLIRVAIGPLALSELLKGTCRVLTPTEKTALDHALARGKRTPEARDWVESRHESSLLEQQQGPRAPEPDFPLEGRTRDRRRI